MRPEVEFWSAWLYTMMRGYTLFLELIRGKNRVCVVIRHILPKQPYYAKYPVLLDALFMAHVLEVGELIKTLFEWCRFLLPVWSYGKFRSRCSLNAV